MTEPRLHPNGFIQYDLPSNQGRLHIWHPDLPVAQVVHTPIHDHTFDFMSRIILGRLTHIVFDFHARPAGGYHLHGARAASGEDTRLEPLNIIGDMEMTESHLFSPGDQYTFLAGKFHRSVGNGLTATIMEKTFTGQTPFPRIAVPVGVDPDNNFRRHQYDTSMLARYVDMVLDKVAIV